ncbi:aKG-HExxH-type peptide beta-hydroxylase [Streptomyces tendae]|uniref:aKG-HExxH-type peptide beta-hydroxylase n=1 Tax=Streptomyces tendae TaxID=1932 RepID=UPI002492872E|nr:HEXXH motif-containing putative peptide modification protein [Streptomyces tendae]
MIPASVPTDVFVALARTRPLPAATAALRAAIHARRMLLLKALLVRVERQGSALSDAAHRDFEDDWALLERAERADGAAVRDVLDYPTVGAWLTEALAARPGTAFEAHLPHLRGVAVAAAVRSGRAPTGRLAAPSGLLALPGLGVLRSPSGWARAGGGAGPPRLTAAAGPGAVDPRPRRTRSEAGAPGPEEDATGWSALRTLPGGDTVLDDLDPYRVPSRGIGSAAAPAADSARTEYRTWAARWRQARALLAATDPGRVGETDALVRSVVPLATGRGAGIPSGATLRAAPGAVLTQTPADAPDLAETLVHETHHSKLAALDEAVALCRPGGGALHRVAWRPDPRPVPSVLQGAYAHLALLDLWSRAERAAAVPEEWRRRAAERFARYREQVGAALAVLGASDELTCAGRSFVREMHGHHESLGVAARNST